MANRSRLSILLDIQRKGQGAFKATEADIKRLDSTASNLSRGLAGIATGAGIAGALELGRAAFDLAQVGAESQRLTASLNTLAQQSGTTGTALLQSLRAASRGTIDDSALILAANRANLLGVADTAEELGKLLEVARVRGRALGLSTSQAFDDLVTGIGRASPLILDNLGIVTGGNAVYENFAASIGKSANALTDAEKKQALFNLAVDGSAELVAATAGQADDAASSFERLSAAGNNLKGALGEDFADGSAESVGRLATETQNFANIINEVGTFNAVFAPFTIAAQGLGDALGITSQEARDLAQSSDDVSQAASSADRAMLQAASSASQLTVTMSGSGRGFIGFAQNVLGATRVLQEFIAVQRQLDSFEVGVRENVFRDAAGVADIVGQERALALANETASAVGRQVEALKSANLSSGERLFREEQIRNNATQVFRTIENQDRATQKLAKSGVKQVNQEFEQLKSTVQGVLSGSLNVGVGVKASDLLPREDAINEDARRLADVAVKGYESPWAEYLNQKFPNLLSKAFEGGGDIKTVAATALRDFEDGLNVSLLDKEKAKERVRRMITGEQNLAALGEEIARELAGEFGTTAGPQFRQQVNKALGVSTDGASVPVAVDTAGLASSISSTFQAAFGGNAGGAGEGAGASFGQGALSGIAGIGTQMVQTLDVELRSDTNIALLASAGKAAGKRWGDMFLSTVGDNVPGALIDILVNLVTPGVTGQQQANQSLTQAAS